MKSEECDRGECDLCPEYPPADCWCACHNDDVVSEEPTAERVEGPPSGQQTGPMGSWQAQRQEIADLRAQLTEREGRIAALEGALTQAIGRFDALIVRGDLDREDARTTKRFLDEGRKLLPRKKAPDGR